MTAETKVGDRQYSLGGFSSRRMSLINDYLSVGSSGSAYNRIDLSLIGFSRAAGFIHDGWKTEDYLANAIKPIAGEGGDGGFECLVVWGPPGSGKSNFARQLLYRAVYRDWDKVLRYTITSIPDLLDVVQHSNGQRIEGIIIDDISRTLPRQLWHIDKKLYIAFSKALQVIRSLFNVIIVTIPHLSFAPESVLNMTTMEAHVTPKHLYAVWRWRATPHYYVTGKKVFSTKVLIDAGKFKLTDEPLEVYKQYKQKRVQMAYDAFKEVREALEHTRRRSGVEEGDDFIGEPVFNTLPMISLTCFKCGFVWPYKPKDGVWKDRARCPECKTFVPVPNPTNAMSRTHRLKKLVSGKAAENHISVKRKAKTQDDDTIAEEELVG